MKLRLRLGHFLTVKNNGILMASLFLVFGSVVATVSMPTVAFAVDEEPIHGKVSVDKPGADGAIESAHVSFVQPKDGQTIPKKYLAKFAVKGMKVVPAGAIEVGTGHFHLIIDAAPVKEGTIVPADASHIHFGKGQTEYEMNLTPGHHTLVLEFADGAHRAYNSMMTQSISVEVK